MGMCSIEKTEFSGPEDRLIHGQEALGTDMMERWLKEAEAELGNTQILLDSLGDIALRFEALEEALLAQGMEHIRAMTHSLKGCTGTLRMKEIYLKISDLEDQLNRKPLDIEKVRKEFSTAKEMFSLIPKKYFHGKQVQPEQQRQISNGLPILVVDDNAAIRKFITHILQRLYLNCREAENGAMALNMLRKETYRLVLLDYQMPVMDGLATLKQIRKDSLLKDLHVIMQTANNSEKDIRAFFQAGCNDCIAKPINPGVLQHKLERFIDSNRN